MKNVLLPNILSVAGYNELFNGVITSTEFNLLNTIQQYQPEVFGKFLTLDDIRKAELVGELNVLIKHQWVVLKGGNIRITVEGIEKLQEVRQNQRRAYKIMETQAREISDDEVIQGIQDYIKERRSRVINVMEFSKMYEDSSLKGVFEEALVVKFFLLSQRGIIFPEDIGTLLTFTDLQHGYLPLETPDIYNYTFNYYLPDTLKNIKSDETVDELRDLIYQSQKEDIVFREIIDYVKQITMVDTIESLTVLKVIAYVYMLIQDGVLQPKTDHDKAQFDMLAVHGKPVTPNLLLIQFNIIGQNDTV